jgi:hypothetical protein
MRIGRYQDWQPMCVIKHILAAIGAGCLITFVLTCTVCASYGVFYMTFVESPRQRQERLGINCQPI